MELYPIEMLHDAVLSIAIGAIMGIYYDVLNALRSSIFNSRTVKCAEFIKDLMFMISMTLVFVLILYYFNDGAFRAVFLCAFLLGLFLYRITISKLISRLIRSMLGVLTHIMSVILKPAIYILKKAKKAAQFSIKAIAKPIKKRYNEEKVL